VALSLDVFLINRLVNCSYSVLTHVGLPVINTVSVVINRVTGLRITDYNVFASGISTH
jgi:hypothetical protein